MSSAGDDDRDLDDGPVPSGLHEVPVLWTCKACGALVPGDQSNCPTCGAAAPPTSLLILRPGRSRLIRAIALIFLLLVVLVALAALIMSTIMPQPG